MAVVFLVSACLLSAAAFAAAGRPELRTDQFRELEPGDGAGPRTQTLLAPSAEHWSLGARVAIAGDLDRDGLPELAVAAIAARQRGEVWLWSGTREGLAAQPLSKITGTVPRGGFGRILAAAGDLDGDGLGDLVVGRVLLRSRLYREDRSPGAVNLRLGKHFQRESWAPSWSRTDQPGAFLAEQVIGVGDINGDGFGDLAVPVITSTNAATSRGRVQFFFGSANGLRETPDFELEGMVEGEQFGATVVPLGDLNGDRIDDFLIGAPGYRNVDGAGGRFALFRGGRPLPSKRPHLVQTGSGGSRFGVSAVGRGDFNGDGRPELVVAAPGATPGPAVGLVLAYPGQAEGPGEFPIWEVKGVASLMGFGEVMSVLPDFNGDGYADLAISAPRAQLRFEIEGEVRVYLGGPKGLAAQPVLRLVGGCRAAGFGRQLAAADLDGDGCSDLVVGTPNLNQPKVQPGRCDVIYGSRTAFRISRVLEAVNEGERSTPGPLAVAPDPESEVEPERLPRKEPAERRYNAVALLGLLTLAGSVVGAVWTWERRRRRKAIEAERARVVRDLHDRIGGIVTQLAQEAPGTSTAATAAEIAEGLEEVVYGLDPGRASLEDFATFLADFVCRRLARTPTRPRLDLPLNLPPGELDVEVRRHLHGVVSEAVGNALKHAHATELTVRLQLVESRLVIEVADNGCGFDLAGVAGAGDGLRNFRQRMDAVSGRVTIQSAPGSGTRLRFEVPYRAGTPRSGN